MKIAINQMNSTVGDIAGNAAKIIKCIQDSERASVDADLVIFPELCITGYPPEDLLLRPEFVEDEQKALKKIAAASKKCSFILGATYRDKMGRLFNAAYHLTKGEANLVAIKSDLPNYGVFDEKRYFHSSDFLKTFKIKGRKIGVLICEDTWTPAKTRRYRAHSVDLLVSINASPFHSGKIHERLEVARKRVKEAKAELVYVNACGGQDELFFDGASFYLNKKGDLLGMAEQSVSGWHWMNEVWEPHDTPYEDRYKVACLALHDYVHKNGFSKVLLGLSGGMDSALTAVMAVDALGRSNVRLVVLPTRFTSKASFVDANQLCKNLGIEPEQIDIEPAFRAFTAMLAHNFRGTKPGLAEENMQSRIRGLTLMAISNKHNELLLTTGNKSEIATGYATLYGDMCGAYNVLKDLYKTEVYEMARWKNSKDKLIPENIFKKAPSAELRHNQKDQDSLPPYDMLDAILKLFIDERKSIKEVVKKNFNPIIVERVWKLLQVSEYKRSQAAPGVKLSRNAFGKDWRYPLTNNFKK